MRIGNDRRAGWKSRFSPCESQEWSPRAEKLRREIRRHVDGDLQEAKFDQFAIDRFIIAWTNTTRLEFDRLKSVDSKEQCSKRRDTIVALEFLTLPYDDRCADHQRKMAFGRKIERSTNFDEFDVVRTNTTELEFDRLKFRK